MEGQGKRLLIAVVAAMGIFFLWQVIFPPKKEEPPAAGSGTGSGSALVQQSVNHIAKASTPAAGAGRNGAPGAATAETHKRAADDEIAIDDYAQMRIAFS